MSRRPERYGGRQQTRPPMENGFCIVSGGWKHRENQVLEAASRALASNAAAVSALWNYFVSELRQSASQNLSKKDGAVKAVMFFSERFCEADWCKF